MTRGMVAGIRVTLGSLVLSFTVSDSADELSHWTSLIMVMLKHKRRVVFENGPIGSEIGLKSVSFAGEEKHPILMYI